MIALDETRVLVEEMVAGSFDEAPVGIAEVLLEAPAAKGMPW